jgi:hypothetical protein
MKNRYFLHQLFAFTIFSVSSVSAQIYMPNNQGSTTTNSTVFGDLIPVKEAKVEVNVVYPQGVSQEGGIKIHVSEGFEAPPPPRGLEPESNSNLPFALWVNKHSFGINQVTETTTFSVERNGRTSVGHNDNFSNNNAMLNVAGLGRFYQNTSSLDFTELNFKEMRWNSPQSFHFKHQNNDNSIITLEPSGKVGIGTGNDNLNGNYLLYVNGKMLSEEHTVKLKADWPDYVFEEEYEMLSIEDLEQFIRTNKHLPDVPTAAYIAEHGVELGSTQAALLKQIEELTLRLIEMEKRLKQLEGHESN